MNVQSDCNWCYVLAYGIVVMNTDNGARFTLCLCLSLALLLTSCTYLNFLRYTMEIITDLPQKDVVKI